MVSRTSGHKWHYVTTEGTLSISIVHGYTHTYLTVEGNMDSKIENQKVKP